MNVHMAIVLTKEELVDEAWARNLQSERHSKSQDGMSSPD